MIEFIDYFDALAIFLEILILLIWILSDSFYFFFKSIQIFNDSFRFIKRWEEMHFRS